MRPVDAEEVLNAIGRYAREDGYINLHIGTIDSIIGNVSTVKRPHDGEWIITGGYRPSYKCSICCYSYSSNFIEHNFCPNCGASMLTKESDENG